MLLIEGAKCTILGAAQEVFQTRLFEETPQNVLQELAIDLQRRASRAWRGNAQMAAAFTP